MAKSASATKSNPMAASRFPEERRLLNGGLQLLGAGAGALVKVVEPRPYLVVARDRPLVGPRQTCCPRVVVAGPGLVPLGRVAKLADPVERRPLDAAFSIDKPAVPVDQGAELTDPESIGLERGRALP